MDIITTDFGLLKLMQLTSVNLPVGGFAFSQGLETACELGWVKSLDDARDWIGVQIQESLGHLDLPIFLRAYDGADLSSDLTEFKRWNRYILASRETQEFLSADIAMGAALKRLMANLNIDCAVDGDISFVCAFAFLAHYWQIDKKAACLGYSWTWLENQISAAMKLVPLGQNSAQQLTGLLQPQLTKTMEFALTLSNEEIGSSLIGLSIASSMHETQYSRLFRS
ncbi:urease accessory protein UreF [Sessilibacter sp. MAH4]